MSLDWVEHGFMQRALAVGLITAVVCPAIGVFLVPRRLALIADTLAHTALAGVALGLLAGAAPWAGALVVTLLGAVAIDRLRARGALQGDAALAVFLTGGLAVAVVAVGLAGALDGDVFALLFGSLVTVSPRDVWVVAALGAVVVAAVGAFYGPLLAVTVHEELARGSGLPVTALNLMLMVLTALTVVVAMRAVGVLLVGALIVLPTLAAFAVAGSFRQALGLAIGVAVVAVVVGLTAAFHLNLVAGGAIALTALLLFAALSLAGRATLARRAGS